MTYGLLILVHVVTGRVRCRYGKDVIAANDASNKLAMIRSLRRVGDTEDYR